MPKKQTGTTTSAVTVTTSIPLVVIPPTITLGVAPTPPAPIPPPSIVLTEIRYDPQARHLVQMFSDGSFKQFAAPADISALVINADDPASVFSGLVQGRYAVS